MLSARGLKSFVSSSRLAISRRAQSTYQPPADPKSGSNAHREFYKHHGRPVFKAFLVAIFTYEVLYWGWLKLESMEVKEVKEGEVKSLETEIKRLQTGTSNSKH